MSEIKDEKDEANVATRTPRRQLSLKDLKLEVKTQEQVWGGLGEENLGQWAMGPKSDSGAGDASAWNEGDISLAEQG